MTAARADSPGESDRLLTAECDCFTRHLVRRPANQSVQRRYVDALAGLGLDRPRTAHERRVLALARRAPLLTGAIDTAAAVFARDALLRKRLFVLCAILETEPDYADYFLAPPPPSPRLLLDLTGYGLRAGIALIFGSLLWAWTRASR